MTYRMRVPARWQFGALDPRLGRGGQVRRAVAGRIFDALFGEDGRASAEATITAFAARLGGLRGKAGAEAVELLAAWGLVPDQAAAQDGAAAASGGQKGERRSIPQEDAFCLAVHALAMGLAGGMTAGWTADVGVDSAEEAAQEEDAESPDVEDLGDESDADRESGDGELAMEKAHAVEIIAALLPLWRRRSAGTDRESHEEKVRLVAKVLLECLLEVLPENMFAVEEQRIEVEDGEPRTRQRVVVKDQALIGRIRGLLRELPYRFTLQPLAQPALYSRAPAEERADSGDDEGQFEIELIGYRRSNDFLKGCLERTAETCDFRDYVRAVNAQQAVAWRINRPVLAWACHLAGLARGRKRWDEGLREAVRQAGLSDAVVKEWRKWVKDEFYSPQAPASARKKYNRPGELLDNPLVRSALDELAPPHGEDGSRPAFFLPWKADYRGRIYAETPWLSPQGGDLQRALFEFAQGRRLDAAGVKALRRHGANLAKRERILTELGIEGRQVLTLDERERWIEQRENEILQCAGSPLAHRFWCEASAKPMQFLAFCFAYRDWKEDAARPISLPVQIDGTCNGLQHIAVLTGDEHLAMAVNVAPRSDGLPGDIYSEVAADARTTVGRIADLVSGGDKRLAPLRHADRWLMQHRDALLSRATAKRVVMTVPYGAVRESQAKRVLDSIEKTIEGASQRAPEAKAIAAWLTKGRVGSGKFVRKCTRGFFRASRARIRKGGEGARQELKVARAFGAFVALALVIHLRAALDRKFAAAKHFADWLRDVAGCCSGLPLLWLTPLGLPVCQDKFERRRANLSVQLGELRITLGASRLQEQVSGAKQARALLPNLIHSLDATHLAMTINEAVRRGIRDFGSIHDCLLCHPNDASALAGMARETFATLYRKGPAGDARPAVLADWAAWMQFVARVAALRQPSLVKGAVENPGGLGERWLEEAEGTSGKRRLAAAAKHNRDVLAEFKRLPPAKALIARLLLEYAASVPAAAAARGQHARKKHPLRIEFPAPPQGVLGAVATSDYFFS